jgi:hypothetical protein
MLFQILADGVMLLHFGFVLFVVLGLVLILLGGWRGWGWVRRPWFRILHLLAIAVVAGQAWLGRICPLTLWENALRVKGGGTPYPGAFFSHWVAALLYYSAPAWVFTLLYTAFGLLVLASWMVVPPRALRRRKPDHHPSD